MPFPFSCSPSLVLSWQKKVLKIAAVFVAAQRHAGVCWELLRTMFQSNAHQRFKARPDAPLGSRLTSGCQCSLSPFFVHPK
jgi:hypothetical protein